MTGNLSDGDNPGRRRDHGGHRGRLLVIAVAAAGGASLAGGPAAGTALAATNSGTQAVTATVVAGSVLVTPPLALTIGTLNPGAANNNIALGSTVWQDTIGGGTAWSGTLSSNDWSSGTSHIPFTDMTINPGGTMTAAAGATGPAPTAGTAAALSGTDTTPGTTQSSPVTLINGSTTTVGTYTQGGSTISVVVPGGTATGAYTGTLTYTITG